MPFLTNAPLPQCLQPSPLTPPLLVQDHQRGSRPYLSRVKCLDVNSNRCATLFHVKIWLSIILTNSKGLETNIALNRFAVLGACPPREHHGGRSGGDWPQARQRCDWGRRHPQPTRRPRLFGTQGQASGYFPS